MQNKLAKFRWRQTYGLCGGNSREFNIVTYMKFLESVVKIHIESKLFHVNILSTGTFSVEY